MLQMLKWTGDNANYSKAISFAQQGFQSSQLASFNDRHCNGLTVTRMFKLYVIIIA